MKNRMLSVCSGIFTVTLTGILLLSLFLNISTLWSVGKIKRGDVVVAGWFSAIIGSGSMEPSISVNDLLLINGSASYRENDIITYVSVHGSLVTHRIKEVTEYGYITQGDANNTIDEEISSQRVLGKVSFILPGIGGIVYGLLSPEGVGLLVCACVLFWLFESLRREENEEDSHETSGSRVCVFSEDAAYTNKETFCSFYDFGNSLAFAWTDSENVGELFPLLFSEGCRIGS